MNERSINEEVRPTGGGRRIRVADEPAVSERPAEAERQGRGFRAAFPVRWSDCDPAGIVYYPNFYSYQEAATVEFFRAHGSSWKVLCDRYGVHFPRLESHCRHFEAVSYEDIVEIELHVPEITRKVVTMGFKAFRQHDQVLLCEGYVKFAMATFAGPNGERPRAVELPNELRQLFSELQ